MKLLSTLFFLLFVSFASAQDAKNDIITTDSITKEATEKTNDALNQTLVISVRGIKTMEEIDIENYNKSTYIKMISSQKRKSKIS